MTHAFIKMITTALRSSPWIPWYQNTAVNIIWERKSTFIVYSPLGFASLSFSFLFPYPTSTRSVFAAEIFLGPKGKHIPSLTVVQSLTITVPPSPLWLPKRPEVLREPSCPSCLGNVLRWTGCTTRPVNKLWALTLQKTTTNDVTSKKSGNRYCYFFILQCVCMLF